MAVQCPQCSAESNIDFGMAQCDSCQAVFYVNLDGSVSVSDGSSDVPVEEPSLQTFHSVEDLQHSIDAEQRKPDFANTNSPDQDWANQQSWNNNAGQENWSADSSAHPLDEFIEFPQAEQESAENQDQAVIQDDTASAPFSSEFTQVPFEQESAMGAEDLYAEPQQDLVEDTTVDYSVEEEEAFVEASSEQAYEEPHKDLEAVDNVEELRKSPQEHLQEVVDFGNSDKSQARHGILYYNLMIEGIDTSEERRALMDILSNRQLMLSVEDLIKEIDDGKLLIESLNPVKASVLVSELEMSGMEVSWTQGAINE